MISEVDNLSDPETAFKKIDLFKPFRKSGKIDQEIIALFIGRKFQGKFALKVQSVVVNRSSRITWIYYLL
jgi:hypothetical protein